MSAFSKMERQAYRAEFASGLLEAFVGTALVFIGVGWLFDRIALVSNFVRNNPVVRVD